MKASFLRTLFFLVASAALLVSASAFRPADSDKHIKLTVAAAEGKAGDIVWVTIKAKTDKHWHTYSTRHIENEYGLGPIETTIELADDKLGKIEGAIKVPKPHVEYDEGFEVKIETLEGSWEWKVPIRLKKDLKGAVKGKFTIGFQMCDTTSCLPPDYIDVPFTITVSESLPDATNDATNDESNVATVSSAESEAGPGADTPAGDKTTVAAASAASTTTAPVDTQDEIAAEKRKGLLNFFFYAMGIGFLALLTPCVFPMIPITVSFFTKRNEKERSKAVRDAFIYALGIISTFTLIGIIVSALFGATSVQDLAANPWMNLAIGVLFVALAFNLFGAYEIQVPVSIMNKLNKKAQGGSGVFSVLLMGLVFSLTSFTCTVPFIGTLLISAAGGDYLYPAVGTLGFATAFAIPFFFLALFPSLLVALPKAGGWMNNMKVVMGFIEIAAAVKFFSTAEFVWGIGILPREVFLAIWVGVLFLIVLYVLGVFEMKLDSKLDKVSGLRAFFAVAFASLAFYFFNGMMGSPLQADLEALLPPDNYEQLISMSNGESVSGPTTSSAGLGSMEDRVKRSVGIDHSAWLSSLDEAKKKAMETGKPIFIDFTGFACTNCRLMEKTMFPRASVKQRFENMVLVQLFTDRKEEPYITNQNIMKQYGTVANPLYVILKPDGSYVAQTSFTRDEQAFLNFLDQAFES